MTKYLSFTILLCQIPHRWGRPHYSTGQFTPSSPYSHFAGPAEGWCAPRRILGGQLPTLLILFRRPCTFVASFASLLKKSERTPPWLLSSEDILQSDLKKMPEAITPKPLFQSNSNLHSVIRRPRLPLTNTTFCRNLRCRVLRSARAVLELSLRGDSLAKLGGGGATSDTGW